jgi:hypothetical protein
MNPGLALQLAAMKRDDLERAAGGHRGRPAAAGGASPGASSGGRGRPAVARHAGVFLISVGRRLAGPEGRVAFDGPRGR